MRQQLEEITKEQDVVTEPGDFLERLQKRAEPTGLEDIGNFLTDVGQVED